MRSVLLLLAAALMARGQQAQHAHNQLTPAEQASGWILLFDGRTTTGWQEISGAPFPPTWRIEDGCLRTIVHPDSFQDIRTDGEWRSFEFSFEWKIASGGNSGVKYLLHRVDRWRSRTGEGFHARARGFEYQLADDAANDDARSDPSHSTGALYGYLNPPSDKRQRAAGEWNESRIVVRGNRIEEWLNGALTVAFDLESPALADLAQRRNRNDASELFSLPKPKSAISLQHHNSEVWFRCLKLRPVQ